MSWFSALPADAKKTIVKTAVIVGIGFMLGFMVRGCLKPIIGDQQPPVVEEQHGMGWRDDPAYVQKTVATFARPFFGDTAKTIIQGGEDKDAFLWKINEQVTGKPWQSHNQNGTGCCVGEGFSTAVELVSSTQIALLQNNHDYHPISASAVYALSREVGNYLVNNDGSTGADAAKALMQFGCISCAEADDDNFTNPAHANRAKLWGKKGLPAELKALAAKHKIKTASLVRTPEEVRAALINGYPVPICSSVGFEPTRRDKDGFCKMGGSWPHCMCIAGYRADKKAFLVINSWGDSSATGPQTLGQPGCSFWITWDACQRICKAGESYALSAYDGYPKQDLDVFIKVPAPTHVAMARLLRDRFSIAP